MVFISPPDLAANLVGRKCRCLHAGVGDSCTKRTKDFIELISIDSLNGLREHLKFTVFEEERRKASRIEVITI